MAAVEVPLRNLDVKREEQHGTFALHFSAPALFRDARGQVVHRFQCDFRLLCEPDRPDNYRAGDFAFAEPVELATSRCRVESAVTDRITGRTGARRAVFVAAPEQGAALSSPALIRRIEPVDGPGGGADPFQFKKGRLAPDLTGRIPVSVTAGMAIYLVIQAEPGRPGPAPIQEFSQDRQVTGRGEARLPGPGQDGRIPRGTRVPAGGWPAGQSGVRLLLMEAGRPVREERLGFVIE